MGSSQYWTFWYIKQGTTYTEVETYLPRVIPKNNVSHVSSSLSRRPTNDTNSNPNGCHITPNDIPTFYYGTISKTPPQTASWKRMVRTTLSLESTLKISLGSKRPVPSDQDHPETPVKRRLVSQDSSSNNIVLAEAESQPCQHPWVPCAGTVMSLRTHIQFESSEIWSESKIPQSCSWPKHDWKRLGLMVFMKN